MQRITTTFLLLATMLIPSVAIANNGNSETFGLGRSINQPVSYASASTADTFGLGGYTPQQQVVVSPPTYRTIVQDCPDGQCPIPTTMMVIRQPTSYVVTDDFFPSSSREVTRRVTRSGPLRTVTREVVDNYCPTGTCPTGTVVRTSTPVYYSEPVVVSSRVVSNCPTCPTPTYYSQPVRTSTSYCPTGTCPDYAVSRSVRRSVTRNYNPQWTFPGDIDSHLMGPPHYVSASQLSMMSYDQKLQLHDQQHNSGIGGGRIRQAFANRPRLFNGRIMQRFRSRRGW